MESRSLQCKFLSEDMSGVKLIKKDIPDLSSNQILVKVMFTYICGTQLNEINGKKGKDPYLPHTLGHEASGKILKIGKIKYPKLASMILFVATA